MQRFALIDGNAIVHRAYHALPPLTAKDGQLVNAVYGFISMLLKVIKDFKPAYLAVVFDRPEKTFRQQIYKQYQAQRPEMKEELAAQFPVIKNILAAMKIQVFDKAGYEADDLIGTLTKRVTDKNQKSKIKNQKYKLTEVIIVTGDRDILQLVNEQVKVYMPVKGLREAKLFGIKEVEDKYGIKPSQIIDYKALVGDQSDNYPGVSGIGPKTASGLLQKYWTIENLFKHLDELGNKNISGKLLEGEKDVSLAFKLAKIVTDVPVSVDLEGCRFSSADTPETELLFKKLGFRSLLKRLKGESHRIVSTLEKRRLPKRGRLKNSGNDVRQLTLT